jgi:iron(III) transport system substrate-binding protein
MNVQKLRLLLVSIVLIDVAGCGEKPAAGPNAQGGEVSVYCGVDEPYAGVIFAAFNRQTGIRVVPTYDIESSKSVGLAEKLMAEKDHPRADVWWCSEAFQSARLVNAGGVLKAYRPAAADDVPDQYKDPGGYWTGVGLRARVLAIGDPAPPFKVTGLKDLLDPRLKGKICISVLTAGATGGHAAALYTLWGPDKASDFFRKLRDNGVNVLGGNSVVADQVGYGNFELGLTDSDDVANTAANGGKISIIVPDQGPDGEGTLAMPTSVGLVNGCEHENDAKKLIDFLVSRKAEQVLIDMNFARWSVRGGGDPLKALRVDYSAAARIFPQAEREATDILRGTKQ